ncbi:MAG: hypothetical protein JWN82_562 [Candidatus Saccharibacteria bacterium]|nr:hypothetical protein [Candidatus Saccharibacteria bacterium]
MAGEQLSGYNPDKLLFRQCLAEMGYRLPPEEVILIPAPHDTDETPQTPVKES